MVVAVVEAGVITVAVTVVEAGVVTVGKREW